MISRLLKPTPLYANQTVASEPQPPVTTLRGLRTTLALLRLLLGSFRLAMQGKLDGVVLGNRIAEFCSRMGLLWIKVGQLMSMRPDVFPAAICDRLARLQDGVPGFPAAQARAIIERELGQSCDALFSQFDDTPLAAASIGQVHRAVLRGQNKDVVVKVRRPHIRHTFEKDMIYIRSLCRLLHLFKILPCMQWLDLIWELDHVFSEEIDFRYEASNSARLRRSLSRHQIIVPRLYQQMCTQAVIVMEFLPGVLMNQVTHAIVHEPEKAEQWMAENAINATRVGKTLLHSFLRQLFEDNLFHSDLHPGNLMVLRNSRLAFIDFGSIGTIEGDLLRKYFLYLDALAKGNYAKAVDLFLLILPELPAGNVTAAKEAMIRSLQDWGSRSRVPQLPYHVKSASAVTDEMTAILTRHKINLPWSTFRLLRAWTTMDASLRYLCPTMDLASMMRTYARDRQRRRLVRLGVTLPQKLQHLQKLIDMPVEYAESSIYRGAMVRRLSQVFEGTSSKVSRIIAEGLRLTGWIGSSLWLLGLLIASRQLGFIGHLPAFLEQFYGSLPNLDAQVWILFAILSVACLRHIFGLAARFSQDSQIAPGLT